MNTSVENTGFERLHRAINTQLSEIKALEAALHAAQNQLTTLKARVVSVLEPFAEAACKLDTYKGHWPDVLVRYGVNAPNCRAARDLRDELVGCSTFRPAKIGEKHDWPDCKQIQCEQAHEAYRIVAQMLGIEIPDNIYAVGKAVRISEAIRKLQSNAGSAVVTPTPKAVVVEPTCKHCGKVVSKHWESTTKDGLWCSPTTDTKEFTPVPVAEPEVAADESRRRTWVRCPVCGEPDMRKETDSVGNPVIFCVNHACASNGGTNSSAVQQAAGSTPTSCDCKRVHSYITQLAASLARDHVASSEWEYAPSSLGVLAQLDHMLQGLRKERDEFKAKAEKPAGPTPATGASKGEDSIADYAAWLDSANAALVAQTKVNANLQSENIRLRELLARVRGIHRSTPEGVAMKVPNSLATEIDKALAVGGGK